jgi:hypothetical protein
MSYCHAQITAVFSDVLETMWIVSFHKDLPIDGPSYCKVAITGAQAYRFSMDDNYTHPDLSFEENECVGMFFDNPDENAWFTDPHVLLNHTRECDL